MMVGRDVVLTVARTGEHQATGPVLAELRGLQVHGDRGNLAVKGVDLALRAGEIVGMAGVDGNGQSELAEALAGLRHPSAGQLLIRSEDVSQHDPQQLAGCGVHYVPADRNARGAVPSLSVAANAVLKNHRTPPYSRWGILNHAAIHGFAQQLVEDYDVRCPSVEVRAGSLSGGNLQKLILRPRDDVPSRHPDRRAPHPRAGCQRHGIRAQATAQPGRRRDGRPPDLSRPGGAARPGRPDRGDVRRPAGVRGTAGCL